MNDVFIFLNLIFIIITCIINLLIYNKLNKYFKIIEFKLENNISRTYSNNSNNSNDSNKNITCSDDIIYRKKKYNKQNISSGTLFDTFNIKKNKESKLKSLMD